MVHLRKMGRNYVSTRPIKQDELPTGYVVSAKDPKIAIPTFPECSERDIRPVKATCCSMETTEMYCGYFKYMVGFHNCAACGGKR